MGVRANDIAYVRERPGGEPVIRPVVEDARIFHEHALAVASTELSSVLYIRDLRYAWV